jgi:hypothetical protein
MILDLNHDYFLNVIKKLIFLMVKCGVLFEVQTDFLYTVQKRSGFKGLKNTHTATCTAAGWYR